MTIFCLLRLLFLCVLMTSRKYRAKAVSGCSGEYRRMTTASTRTVLRFALPPVPTTLRQPMLLGACRALCCHVYTILRPPTQSGLICHKPPPAQQLTLTIMRALKSGTNGTSRAYSGGPKVVALCNSAGFLTEDVQHVIGHGLAEQRSEVNRPANTMLCHRRGISHQPTALQVALTTETFRFSAACMGPAGNPLILC